MKKNALVVMHLKLSSSIMTAFTLSVLLLLSGCQTISVNRVDQTKGEPIATGTPLSGVTVYLSHVAPSFDNKATFEQAKAVLRQYGATIVSSEAEAKLIIGVTNYKIIRAPNLLTYFSGFALIFSCGVIPGVEPYRYQVEISVKLNNSYRQQLLLKQTTSIETNQFLGLLRPLYCGGNYPEYCGYEDPATPAALIKTMNEIVEMKKNGDF